MKFSSYNEVCAGFVISYFLLAMLMTLSNKSCIYYIYTCSRVMSNDRSGV